MLLRGYVVGGEGSALVVCSLSKWVRNCVRVYVTFHRGYREIWRCLMFVSILLQDTRLSSEWSSMMLKINLAVWLRYTLCSFWNIECIAFCGYYRTDGLWQTRGVGSTFFTFKWWRLQMSPTKGSERTLYWNFAVCTKEDSCVCVNWQGIKLCLSLEIRNWQFLTKPRFL